MDTTESSHDKVQLSLSLSVVYLQFAMLMNGILGAFPDRIIDFHNGRLIATPIAIIRCRKDRHDTAVVLPLVALHDDLMGPSDKVQTINVRELLRNVLSKGVAGSAG